jgi:hypothetical protein
VLDPLVPDPLVLEVLELEPLELLEVDELELLELEELEELLGRLVITLARTVPLLEDELEGLVATGVTTSELAEVLGRLEDSLPWPQPTSPIKQGSSSITCFINSLSRKTNLLNQHLAGS